MKLIKHNLTLLRVFISSPIFPLILSITIFLVNQLYFGVINLCGDNESTLNLLNTELNNEIARFNYAIFSKETAYQKLIDAPQYNSEYRENLEQVQTSSTEMKESLKKINTLEKSIRKIDPNYEIQYLRTPVGKYTKK